MRFVKAMLWAPGLPGWHTACHQQDCARGRRTMATMRSRRAWGGSPPWWSSPTSATSTPSPSLSPPPHSSWEGGVGWEESWILTWRDIKGNTAPLLFWMFSSSRFGADLDWVAPPPVSRHPLTLCIGSHNARERETLLKTSKYPKIFRKWSKPALTHIFGSSLCHISCHISCHNIESNIVWMSRREKKQKRKMTGSCYSVTLLLLSQVMSAVRYSFYWVRYGIS